MSLILRPQVTIPLFCLRLHDYNQKYHDTSDILRTALAYPFCMFHLLTLSNSRVYDVLLPFRHGLMARTNNHSPHTCHPPKHHQLYHTVTLPPQTRLLRWRFGRRWHHRGRDPRRPRLSSPPLAPQAHAISDQQPRSSCSSKAECVEK